MASDTFRIQGLAGNRSLEGAIRTNGAKNAALKLFAATLLFKDTVVLENVPVIEDIKRMAELLAKLGCSARRTAEHTFEITPGKRIETDLPADISQQFRASIVVAGPLLARFGRAVFYFPGGCVIGKRPIDFFIEGFEAMGARVKVNESSDSVAYVIEAPEGKLRGAEIFLRTPSVTATETFIMAAVLAKGRTVIKNAAMEPEIVSLAQYLRACGADMEGAGSPTITIEGGTLLESKGVPYVTIPDRIEAGSYIILAALAGRDVTIDACDPSHLEALLYALASSGVNLETGPDFVRVLAPADAGGYRAFAVKTQGYPGFPTDLQSPIAVFLTQAHGEGSVFETIFESRFAYVADLRAMGATIRATESQAFITGPSPLSGAEVKSHDLRAGMACIIAAAVAKGESTVHNVSTTIDRGYEEIETRLQALGLDIVRETHL